MEILDIFLGNKILFFKGAISSNDKWQFIIALIILVFGFLLMEFLWRHIGGRLRAFLEKKGYKQNAPYFMGFFPSFRLAGVALILKIAEAPIAVPERLEVLLYGLEIFLLSLAAISFIFQVVRLLDLLYSSLSARTRKKVPKGSLQALKGFLRITGIILVASAFAFTQKEFFPEWLWHHSGWRYVAVLVIFIIVFLGGKFLGNFLSAMTISMKSREEKVRLRLVLEASRKPIYLLLAAIVVYSSKVVLPVPAKVDHFAEVVVSVLGSLAVVIFIYKLLDVIEYELTKFAKRDDNDFDQNFVPMVRMVARVLVVVFGAVYLMQAITGKPMNTILAGLGIGGLAVALAAQDTLKNLFGSFMIIVDKPFVAGDRVMAEGFDGYVEEIGFRSTRIRTLSGHLVSVPNEKMASASIEDIERRPYIRRLANIGITYDTPLEKVEKAVSMIKDILNDHEGYNPEYPPRVYFNEFNDCSLNIVMIYWYHHPDDYWGFQAFNERVNLEIMKAFEAEGIEFAFPTSTTYLAQDEKRPLTISVSRHMPEGLDEK